MRKAIENSGVTLVGVGLAIMLFFGIRFVWYFATEVVPFFLRQGDYGPLIYFGALTTMLVGLVLIGVTGDEKKKGEDAG